MEKEANVILLPSNSPTNIGVCIKPMSDVKVNKIMYFNSSMLMSLEYWQPQHLYITSKEQIKEGGWYYNSLNHAISQADKRYGEIKNPMPHRKIVATTNTSLWEHDDTVPYPKTRPALPQIPESFIKQYVKSGGKINDIRLKIEEYCRKLTCKNSECNSGCKEKQSRIKIDSNNYIIIKPIKESWSREEIEDIHVAVMKQGCLFEGGEWSDEHERLVRLEFNKYAKQNL